MPHQCTNCARVFPDGSKEMLSGCPDCGGNKFQFHPEGADIPDQPAAEPPEPPGGEGSVARTVGSAAATVRDFVGGSEGPPPADSGATASTGTAPASTAFEDAAQADARTSVVSPDELPEPEDRPAPAPAAPPAEESAAEAPAPDSGEAERTDRPDLAELRRELNDQFESIRVLEPGQYELNLMELYDREEYIIALQEDGRYSIQVPDSWRD